MSRKTSLTMATTISTATTKEIFPTWTGNITNHSKTCPRQDLPASILQAYYADIIVLSIVFFIAVVGNLCVLFAVWRRRAKSTRMHLFIVHLAFADLIVALFQVLPELINRLTCDFVGSDGMCRFVRYMQIVGMYGSTYVLVCTAMDRYLAIKYPMQTFKQSKNRVHLAIALAWLLSLVLSIPQLFFWQIKTVESVGAVYCGMSISLTGSRIYVTWYFLSILAFPVVLLAFFYGMIAWIIFANLRMKKQAAAPNRALIRPGQDFAPRASNVKIVSRAKMKTVKMTFVIVILYALCYTPFFTAQLLGVWELINRNSLASQIIHVVACLNSCVNPWVYMGFSGHLLAELKQAFFCGRKKKPARAGFVRFVRRCDMRDSATTIRSRETQPVRSFRSTVATNLGTTSTYGEASQHQTAEI